MSRLLALLLALLLLSSSPSSVLAQGNDPIQDCESCQGCALSLWSQGAREENNNNPNQLEFEEELGGVRAVPRNTGGPFAYSDSTHTAESPSDTGSSMNPITPVEPGLEPGQREEIARFGDLSRLILDSFATTPAGVRPEPVPWRPRGFSGLTRCGSLGVWFTSFGSKFEYVGLNATQNATTTPGAAEFMAAVGAIPHPVVDRERYLMAAVVDNGDRPPSSSDMDSWTRAQMKNARPPVPGDDDFSLAYNANADHGWLQHGVSCSQSVESPDEFVVSVLLRSATRIVSSGGGGGPPGGPRRQGPSGPKIQWNRLDFPGKINTGKTGKDRLQEGVLEPATVARIDQIPSGVQVSPNCLVRLQARDATEDSQATVLGFANGEGVFALVPEKDFAKFELSEDAAFRDLQCVSMWTEEVKAGGPTQVFLVLGKPGGSEKGTFSGPHELSPDFASVTYNFDNDADFDIRDKEGSFLVGAAGETFFSSSWFKNYLTLFAKSCLLPRRLAADHHAHRGPAGRRGCNLLAGGVSHCSEAAAERSGHGFQWGECIGQ
jgi:hypothetical protein